MVDVTVRGAGIFGLSIAWICARRGAKVQISDPNGAGAGSSGGVVGALAPHVPENWNVKKAFQLDSLLMAEAFWQNIEAAGGCSAGYRRSGRLQPVADTAALELAHQRAQTAKDFWLDHADWTIRAANEHSWAPVSATGYLVHDTLSALLHPRQAIAALRAALEAKGIGIQPDCEDRGKVLWASGVPGLQALNAVHHRTVGTGIKGQAAVLKYDARGAPQIFADGLHIIPHDDGTVAVGSTTEREFDQAHTTDAQLDDLLGKARLHVPVLAKAPVLERWAGVRPRSRSRAPMLGPWPGNPGHFIANGGFKIGFGMAPKVALVMADLLLEDKNAIPEGFEVAASL